MHGKAEVVRGVQLLYVENNGNEVTADLIGGEDPVVMAEIAFSTDDSAARQRLLQTFEAWEEKATPLTLVAGEDGVVTLVDEDGTYESAFG